MAGKYTGLVNRLIKAILKNFGIVLLLETQQFYSKQQNRVVTLFVLSQRIENVETGTVNKIQILRTASQIELVQFLGNYHRRLVNERDKINT